MAKKTKPINFEQALSELESIVKQMEKGDMPLEDSLAAFEKGVELTRICQSALKEAEQRINILTQQPEGETLTPFDAGKDA
ncbi:MAG: exodeoxyribonuclease VII small subunit [Gammaproteobacteria bacterium]|nr:exodeoxyribonuclease VII small subunit [Gammaproteobacteria bacterium]